MKYYVMSDIHGFYTPMIQALTENGFFSDTEPHKVIICGDLLDRGKEANKVVQFAKELMEKDELIFIKGNHETLMMNMIDEYSIEGTYALRHGFTHHNSNGTFNTAMQLTGMTKWDISKNEKRFWDTLQKSDFINKIIPHSSDFYETKNYIFVHGWIPEGGDWTEHKPLTEFDWRVAPPRMWENARWANGMDRCLIDNIKVPGKTIVCGHWNASYGHARFHNDGREFGADAKFTPFYDDGIIAIDACTAYSKMVNCIVIEDEPLMEV